MPIKTSILRGGKRKIKTKVMNLLAGAMGKRGKEGGESFLGKSGGGKANGCRRQLRTKETFTA